MGSALLFLEFAQNTQALPGSYCEFFVPLTLTGTVVGSVGNITPLNVSNHVPLNDVAVIVPVMAYSWRVRNSTLPVIMNYELL